jgi:regulator of replication initiation timing
MFFGWEMSCIAKAANKNVAYGGPDDFISAKSMKHMNEALMEKVREGIELISQLKAGLKEAKEENARLQAELNKLKVADELAEQIILGELNEQEDRSEGAETVGAPAGEQESVGP